MCASIYIEGSLYRGVINYPLYGGVRGLYGGVRGLYGGVRGLYGGVNYSLAR